MSLLPPNASQTDIAVANLFLNKLDIDNSNISILPLTAKAEILPHLAVMFDVDISNLEENEARTYIHNALEIHKYKGTVYAVKKAINTVFEIAELVEWFDRDLAAGLFDVDISVTTDLSITYGLDKFEKAKRLINNAKNVRSHLNYFTLKLPVGAGDIEVAGGGVSNTKLTNDLVIEYKAKGNLEIAGGGVSNTKLTNDLVIDYKAKSNLEIAGGGVSNTKLTNDLVIDYKAKGNLEIAGGGVSNTKLTNDLVIDYPLLDIKNFGGGVMDVNLSNEFKTTPLLEEIHIKGAGVWKI